MTVIENIQRQRSISAGQTAPYASAESFGAGYADSLNRIGNSLLEKQKQRDELADLEAEAEAKRAVSDSRIELMKRQQELQLNHTGDAKGFADRFNKDAILFLEAKRASFGNAKSAYMFNDAIDGMLTSFYTDNLDFENRELRSQTIARTNMSIDNEVETVRRGGDAVSAAIRIKDHVNILDKAGGSGGDIIRLEIDRIIQEDSNAVFLVGVCEGVDLYTIQYLNKYSIPVQVYGPNLNIKNDLIRLHLYPSYEKSALEMIKNSDKTIGFIKPGRENSSFTALNVLKRYIINKS